MNYQKVYDAIIAKAKSENRKKLRKNQKGYVYYENHHIIPVCLSGGNEPENLVLLTGREHFICHKLLTYIYKGNRKIALAFHKMSFGIHNKNYKISSKDYEYARELISKIPPPPKSKETCEKLSKALQGHIVSKMTRRKIGLSNKDKRAGKTFEEIYGVEKAKLVKLKQSNSVSGENNPMFGVTSPFKGRHHTEKTKAILREKSAIASTGENNPMYHHVYTKETLKKLSDAANKLKICEYCGAEIKQITYNRLHGKNCKLNPKNKSKN